jgi:hypothetical protein
MLVQIPRNFTILVALVGLWPCMLTVADEPRPQISPYLELILQKQKQEEFEKFSSDLATRLDSAARLLAELSSSNIKQSKEGTRRILVEQATIDAGRLLKASRSPLAAKPLLSFIGVQFEIFSKSDTSPKLQVEMFADDTLKALGLPAVDAVLEAVADGTLEKTRWKAARNLAVEILGEEGLKARVGFLKLAKNEKVQSFVGSK